MYALSGMSAGKTFKEDHKGEEQEQRAGRAIGHIPQECTWEAKQRHREGQ